MSDGVEPTVVTVRAADGRTLEDLAFIRGWGLSLGGGAPVAIWQGDQDHMVPFAHGKWLAEHVPAARAHFVSGAGHLGLPWDDVVGDLLDLAGGRG
ncbi:MAG TPA: hypothetical protein VEJ42_01055 [Streptosporangiaceae bacterium]|nr:hypothetical protein [Streptosporangiaceae bacterium]